MSVKSAQSVTVVFVCSNPTTGASSAADSTPTGTLYLNGTANGATVTVTNISGGVYKAAVTMPTLAAGDEVMLVIAATVSSVAGMGVVWGDVGDTAIASDLNTLLTNGTYGLSAAETLIAAIKTVTDKFAFTVANQVDANALKVGGTTQTGRDLGASVLISPGTGTGQLDVTSGVVKANLVQILAAAITGTAANLVAAFTAFFNVGSPVLTTASVNQTGDGYAVVKSGGAGDNAAIKAKTDNLPASPAAVGSDMGTVSSVTGNVGGNVVGSVASVTAAVTAGTVSDKTGYALTSGEHTSIASDAQTGLTAQGYTATRASYLDTLNGLVAAIWNALTSGMSTVGSIGKLLASDIDAAISSRSSYAGGDTSGTTTLLGRIVGTLAAGTHNPQSGDAYGRIGAAGAGLTSLGDARLADLDAAVSSRLATAGYTAPDNATVGTINTNLSDLMGDIGEPVAADLATDIANVAGQITDLDGDLGEPVGATLSADIAAVKTSVGSPLQASGYTAPDNADIATILSDVGALGAPPSAASIADAVWDEAIAGHEVAGSTGDALHAAGSAGDPWATALPGSYGAGTAGKIIGTELDAAVSSRLATAGYTAPDNADVVTALADLASGVYGLSALETLLAAVKAKTDNLPASPAAVGAAMTLTAAYDAAKTALTVGAYTAPDNADIASVLSDIVNGTYGLSALETIVAAVKAKTDALPVSPAATGDIPSAGTIATAVWAAGTRTLTSFGSLASDAATAVWASATRTLSAFGFTVSTNDAASVAAVKAKTDSLPADPASESQVEAAIAAAAPTVDLSSVPSLVWDEPMSDHETLGTTGKQLSAAAAAGDPWSADIPGDYLEGQAGYLLPLMESKLAAIGAGQITVLSPVSESGTVAVVAGANYAAADGRAIVFTVPVANVPDLASATLELRTRVLSLTASSCAKDGDGENWLISFDASSQETALLIASTYEYQLWVCKSGPDDFPIGSGMVEVTQPIADMP